VAQFPGPIVLVGPMGSGKSTIGYRLAQSLDWAFCDTDKQIEEATGADIPWIFEKEGEAGFRRRERTALLDSLGRRGSIVSTGGGVVELAENRADLIASDAFVVYLKATPAELARRVGNDPNRPLLQGDDPVAVLTRLLNRRGAWYEAVASHTAHTDRMNPKTLSDSLLERIATL
jgi:shikimate kinase